VGNAHGPRPEGEPTPKGSTQRAFAVAAQPLSFQGWGWGDNAYPSGVARRLEFGHLRAEPPWSAAA
jgi:hypothetical protein